MEKMKKCKFCQTDIPQKAKVCPNCKRVVKSHGCLTVLLAFIIVIGGGAAFVMATIGQNDLVQKSVSGVSDKSEYITMEEYNKIEPGMTYEEVKEIVGSGGEVTSQAESGGINITMVTWYGNGVAGSNANVTFTNNEVTAKAQVGLR